MNNPMEPPKFWKYEVRATMAGLPSLKERLLCKKDGYTREEAVEYCTLTWGDRFKKETLEPYVVPKDTHREASLVLSPAQIICARRIAEHEERMKNREPAGFWEIHLHNGTIHRLTSIHRTRDKARDFATRQYGQQVKEILPFGEIK